MNDTINILPDLNKLKNICQSIAVLDAILMPEWEFRYYSFNSKWDNNEMMASMRNGSGDSYFILLNEIGAIIKGCYHESPVVELLRNDENLLKSFFNQVPKEFETFLNEPAFSLNDTTFLVWRKIKDLNWNKAILKFPLNDDYDGILKLLLILDGNPFTYKKWADKYYEKDIPIELIKAIYNHNPITKDLINTLNTEITFEDIQKDLEEIGY